MNVKPTFLSLLVPLLAAAAAVRAQPAQATLKGTVAGEAGEAVGYATVVCTDRADSLRQYGCAADGNGGFELRLRPGKYRLAVTALGYEDYAATLDITENTVADTVVMKARAEQMEALVVRGRMITRTAEGFSLNVADNPLAIGRSASEMLELAPGVSTAGGLQIYGRGGTRVMVNGRLLTEKGAELERYLKLLSAEDIQSIEVVPFTGADMDADMAGGLVKIRLRKNRADGIYGNLGGRYSFALKENSEAWQSSLGLRYRSGPLSLYTDIAYDGERYLAINDGDNIYRDSGMRITGRSVVQQPEHSGSVRIGVSYDFSPRHSIGLEGGYRPQKYVSENNEDLIITDVASGEWYAGNSLFDGRSTEREAYATLNYVFLPDTAGSELKLAFDFFDGRSRDNGRYDKNYPLHPEMDSLYTHRLGNDNRLYSGALDYTWQINGKSAFKAGAKAVYSFMDDYTHYYSERDGGRSEIADYGNEGRMKETVGAVYAAFSSAAGKAFRYSAGLRGGEYTVAKPENRKTRRTEKQDYFDLFPSVSLSATLPSKRPHFLALNYSRKIARPSFSQLIPYRISAANNFVLEGNPQLKPSYINTVSLSWAYDDNYSVAIGMEDAKNVIERLMSVDKQSGSEIVRRPENVARRIKWYANVTFPVSLVRWWKIYLDVYGTLEKLRMPQKNIYGSRLMLNFTNIINLSKTFTWNTYISSTLPAGTEI